MTASGVYQVIERRGRDAGVEVNPHKFRHTFSHVFLDRGGAEGDLMELTQRMNEPRMLARDGRSVRSARARHHHDDVVGA
jgi:integrase